MKDPRNSIQWIRFAPLLPGDLISFKGQNYTISEIDVTGVDAPYFRFENHEGSKLGNWYSYKLLNDPV